MTRPAKSINERPSVHPSSVREYEAPVIIDLADKPETKQSQAGAVPVDAVELGHKGRSWTKR